MKLTTKLRLFYYKQDKLIFWLNLICLLYALIITVLFFGVIDLMPLKIPLFYSLPWGENQLVSHSQFLILPSIIILSSLINLTIAWHLHTSQAFIKKLVSGITFIVSSLIFLTAVQIIHIFV
jgi:hypothetical protein